MKKISDETVFVVMGLIAIGFVIGFAVGIFSSHLS